MISCQRHDATPLFRLRHAAVTPLMPLFRFLMPLLHFAITYAIDIAITLTLIISSIDDGRLLILICRYIIAITLLMLPLHYFH
jgi:hypothetical protein